MTTERFALAGWYTNLVPACSVLPLTEISAQRIRFPFGGFIEVFPDGNLVGVLAEKQGVADITGGTDTDGLSFQKKYRAGDKSHQARDLANQPPVYYRLKNTDRPFRLIGGYRFTADQAQEDGQVEIELIECQL